MAATAVVKLTEGNAPLPPPLPPPSPYSKSEE